MVIDFEAIFSSLLMLCWTYIDTKTPNEMWLSYHLHNAALTTLLRN